MNDYREVWETNKENREVSILETQFNKNISNEIPTLDYRPLFYRFMVNSQLKHWNRDGFNFLLKKIYELEESLGTERFLRTLLNNFNLFTSMYEQLKDIEERINLMELFNGNEELRAKLFAVGIYNDLLNTAYSNGLKLIIKFYGEINNKNQDQKTLTPQIEYLKKRNYNIITDVSDSDVRNAISHGGIIYNGNSLRFQFTQGNISGNKEVSTYQFKTDIKEIFDIASSMCLSWIYYLQNNISFIDLHNSQYLSEESKIFIDRISLSTLLFECKRISSVAPLSNKDSRQYNLEFTHNNLSIIERLYLGIESATKFVIQKNLQPGDYIHVSFESPKTIPSFFTIPTEHFINYSMGAINIEEIVDLNKKEMLMGEVNDENRSEIEDKFRSYLDISNEEYSIIEIEDISLENVKRFSAVFIRNKESTKFQLKEMIKKAIEHIISLENYGFTSHKVKHGDMPADIVYLTVYNQELRRRKKRGLSPENNNFICYVQYDKNKKFPIRNNLVDPYLKKNREGNFEFNWNPNYKGKTNINK